MLFVFWLIWLCFFLFELKVLIIMLIFGGMINKFCIKFSLICFFLLVVIEYGFECYCGDVLVDFWLMGGDLDCNKLCFIVVIGNCDCEWVMSFWNVDDGKVFKVFGF